MRLPTLLVTGLATLGLSSCGIPGTSEVRYKVIVEVNVEGAIHSGSAVWSWKLSKPTVALGSPYNGEFRGEAVQVALGGGRTLFAILRGGDGNRSMAQMLPERLFGDVGRSARGEATRFKGDRLKDLRHIASNVGDQQELNCELHSGWCPMLVLFDDPDDPLSVRKVEQSIKPAIHVQKILVEITSEPVTVGIGDTLPWLSAYPEPRLDAAYRGSTHPTLPQSLWHGDFRWGTEK